MKKLITAVLILVFVLTFVSCGEKSTEEYDLYCYEINNMIKDIDFDNGKIADGKIVLYNDDKEVFNQDYEKYDSGFDIKHIRKDDNKVFFVFAATVDDEEGIMFVNDETNSLLDGIGSLERVNGNSYKYKTFQ